MWVWIGLGGLMLVLVVQTIHLGVVLSSTDQASRGLGYFGLPPSGRDAFRARLRRQAVLLSPILRLVGRFSAFHFDRASFEVDGLRGPKGTCTEDSFAAGATYQPADEDIFVVTQMKCGTTWMQQVVYESLMRGAGDLVDTGTALYAVSPWLESVKSVSVEEAPLIGIGRPARVIKTHFPASVCPLDPHAKYVYVARHPVSCFASCVDFIAANAGRLAPDTQLVEEWFCSDEMWWGPWPAHVEGWWNAARERENVLFVHFEDMKADLAAVVRRVASFLDIDELSEGEVAEIVRKSGFDYMREHERTFEMHPPHLLATDAEMFVKGTADRHEDVADDVRRRISTWCASRLSGANYPMAERYPDTVPDGR
ncbi:MAG: sulfotransferase domain-containing protein [Gemmatimonadota bacterium]